MKKIISILVIVVLFSACEKQDDNAPLMTDSGSAMLKVSGFTVTTATATGLTNHSANSGGDVSSTGGGNSVTAKGICFSTSPNPTTANTTVAGGSGAGTFTCALSGLSAGTLYYVRAFAIKSGATT